MNKLVLFILLLLSVDLSAQTTKLKIKKEKEKPKKEKSLKQEIYTPFSLDIYYGYRLYSKNLYDQLNDKKNFDHTKPVNIVGIGYSGYDHYDRAKKIVLGWNLCTIIPSQIYIQDSLRSRIQGFVFGASFGYSIATPRKKLSITPALGFNTGRTVVTQNAVISQKNPFFSPKISIQPKIIIKRFAISCILESDYDITNPKWNGTFFNPKEKHLLQPFQQSCYTVLFSIGYKPY